MGFSFGNAFKSIGRGLSSAVHTIGSGLSSVAKPVYNSVLKPVYEKAVKPVYEKVVKPVGEGAVKVVGKAAETGEHLVENALDFSQKFAKGNQDLALQGQKDLGTLAKLLENPLVMIGGGILALVVVSKI